MARWKIWIDTGGTFTDCIAIAPDEELKRLKILSSSIIRVRILEQLSSTTLRLDLPPHVDGNCLMGFSLLIAGFQTIILEADKSVVTIDKAIHTLDSFVCEVTSYEEVPVFAARLLTQTSLNQPFPSIDLRLGSTRGTNALLERKGASTALLVTKGFKDLLAIGTQQRGELFQLEIVKAKPLPQLILEVNERIDSQGNIISSLQNDQTENIIEELKKRKIDSVAVALLNSYKNSVHEEMLEKFLRNSGFQYVSLSSKLSRQIKILPRAETTVVNAYLDPVIHVYVNRIKVGLSTDNFKIMSSAGGLLSAIHFKPKDSLLSGPAGGVVGSLVKAQQVGIDRIITFDMGGTSTDVSLCDGRPDYRYECSVGSLKILSPSLSIETIAAGGGSICSYDGYKLNVRPESAGSMPGPACYGSNGPLTITDVNLLLGRLDEDNFHIPIQIDKAREKLSELIASMEKSSGQHVDTSAVLESLIQIANEKMTEAIRKVSIHHGYDVKEYALLSFGGAGGQHACSLARDLKIDTIIVPYDAGLLSAYGIGHASVEKIVERQILQPLKNVESKLENLVQKLFTEAKQELESEGYTAKNITHKGTFLFMRLNGQETPLEIEFDQRCSPESQFIEQYKKIYGHWISGRWIEVESIRVLASVKENPESILTVQDYKVHIPSPYKTKMVCYEGSYKKCPVYRWEDLKVGARIDGPALIINNNTTLFLEVEWTFQLDENQNSQIKRKKENRKPKAKEQEEAKLELYANRFTSIAENMGTMLQRTAFSVNVKERLDFSCALLDASANLIVNAPHIPVHLGSLGVCVREVLKVIEIKEGDVVVTNHPAYGGSHLPDITVIKGVYFKRKLVGYVANRAHHAEIGGKKPGSMPADASCLEEEGIVISPMYLIKKGNSCWKEMEDCLRQSPYPSRSVQENLADLNAALAALHHGENSLISLCEKYGVREVGKYMERLFQYASYSMQEAIKILNRTHYRAIERLDDGSILRVKLTKNRNKLTIDFTGSSMTHSGNMNATKAIVNSVVLYVLRLLVNKPLPLNEGLLASVKLIVPRGILNPTFSKDNKRSPAVVGGNTEISQRLTDTLLKALSLAACSQGTMNNFLFGNESFGYYETICGGTGAGKNFHGADAVHQHMTNTRITDPEIIELRYPVMLEEFSIRKRSGGYGKWKGGNGIIRQFLFKDQLEINLLTQHRIVEPYGLKGGKNGKKGEQYLIKPSGKKKKLKGICGLTVYSGDRIVIKTPGGGGWGK